MSYLTRYYSKLNQFFSFIIKKFIKLKNNFLSFLFLLFTGFFFGNLFGTFVDSIRRLNIADSVLIFLLLLFNEFLNFLIYSNYKKKIDIGTKSKKINFLNAFKIGFLLGIFIDSFKVGS
jgi:cytochrome c biogenesis protein CcdA